MSLHAEPAAGPVAVHPIAPMRGRAGGRGGEAAQPQQRRPGHVLRGRMAAVSVRAAMAAGAWIGFGLGLIAGAVLGALLCWFADAALQWQRDLGLTLGVAQNLLPLGDQVPILAWISDDWFLVIPATGLVLGAVGAVLAAFVTGLVASGYNRISRHALVLVEVPEEVLAAAVASGGSDAASAGGSPAGRPRSMVSGDLPRDVRWLGALASVTPRDGDGARATPGGAVEGGRDRDGRELDGRESAAHGSEAGESAALESAGDSDAGASERLASEAGEFAAPEFEAHEREALEPAAKAS